MEVEAEFEQHIRNSILNGAKQCVLLLGPHGVGKTTMAKTVIEKVATETQNDIIVIQHDASLFMSDVASLHAICTQLHTKVKPPRDLPRRTAKTSTTEYASHLKYCINYANLAGQSVVLLSDHFERFCCTEEPSTTMNEVKLSKRARQSLIYSLVDMVHDPGVFFLIVGMSNILTLQSLFEKRVQSRFIFQTVFKMSVAPSYHELVRSLIPPTPEHSHQQSTAKANNNFIATLARRKECLLTNIGIHESSTAPWIIEVLLQALPVAFSFTEVELAWRRDLVFGRVFGHFLKRLTDSVGLFITRITLHAYDTGFCPESSSSVSIDALLALHEQFKNDTEDGGVKDEKGRITLAHESSPPAKRKRILDSDEETHVEDGNHIDEPSTPLVVSRAKSKAKAKARGIGATPTKSIAKAVLDAPEDWENVCGPALLANLLADSSGRAHTALLIECSDLARAHRQRHATSALLNTPAIQALKRGLVNGGFKDGVDIDVRIRLYLLRDFISRAGSVLLATVARKHRHLQLKGTLGRALAPSTSVGKEKQRGAAHGELALDSLVNEAESALERWKELVPPRLLFWTDLMRLTELGVLQLRTSNASEGHIARPLANSELRVLPATTSAVWTQAVVVFPLYKAFVDIAGYWDSAVEKWAKTDLSLDA